GRRRVQPDRADRAVPADRHREEERHHDGGLRAGRAAQRRSRAARGDPSRGAAALPADPHDDARRDARRGAADAGRGRRRRAAPAARDRDRRRPRGEPGADPLHHAGGVSLPRPAAAVAPAPPRPAPVPARPPDRRMIVRPRLPAALACVATCLLLSACAVGPEYERPLVATPERFRQAPPPGWKEAGAADRLPRGRWWTLFGDPTLDALADQAMRANHSVQAAEAAWRQARAALAQAGAARYPLVSGGFSASRTTGSRGAVSGGLGGDGTVSSESYRLSLDASWEPDLWGRVRRSVEA